MSVLFGGLYDHTNQLTSSYEYVPYECRNVFIDNRWSETTKIERLQKLVLSDYNNYSYRYDSGLEDARIEIMHPLCKEFYKKVKLVAENKELKKTFISRQNSVNKLEQLRKNFRKTKDVYDTSLLENINQKKEVKETLPTISESVRTLSRDIELLSQKIADIEKQINNNPFIKDLWAMLMPGENKYRTQIIEDYKRFEFWYPLKELGWELLFMLPIFIVFYIWNSASIKKDNNVQILISSHLLVVASIPILMKISEVVLELIPKHFFKNLFKILEMLHLIAIWHYVVILVSIGIALFLIYIIQKKYLISIGCSKKDL